MSSTGKGGVDGQPAYVLQTHPFRETSLIIEAFTRDYGRIALVARGARRPGLKFRRLLSPRRAGVTAREDLRAAPGR